MHSPDHAKRKWTTYHSVCWLVACFVTLLFTDAASAEAELSDVQRSVHVQQGVTCLARDELHRQAWLWLRGAEVDSAVQVQVIGSMDDPRSALVRVRSAAGEVSERSFAPGPERCNDFLSAVGLAAALALKKPENVAKTVRVEVPRDDPLAMPDQVPHEARARLPYRLALDAGALLMVPDPTPIAAGGELLLRYQWAQRLVLRAGMAAVWRDAAHITDRLRYSLRSLATRVELCAPFALPGRLQVALCGALFAGRLKATALGPSQRDSTTLRLLDAGPALTLSLPVHARLELLLGVALLLGLEPRRLSARHSQGGAPELHPLPRLSALFSLGLAFTLGARPAPAAAAKDRPRARMNLP